MYLAVKNFRRISALHGFENMLANFNFIIDLSIIICLQNMCFKMCHCTILTFIAKNML